MSLLGYVLLLTAALCCSAAPAPDGSCLKPERKDVEELQGDWEDDTYPAGTRATYQCRPGYSRVGRIAMICSNGKWEYVSPKGQCRKRSCGHPGDIQFGSFQLIEGESFVFGAIVEYVCEDGYQMVSRERTRQCTATGWSNYAPHCEVRNCPPVEAASNVNVLSTSYDEEYSVGQVVRFECKGSNLMLDGASEIFCTSEGGWNLEPPKCIEIRCKLPTLENGKVNNPKRGDYNNNDVIQITCNRGFSLSTSREIKCTKDGWNPNPSCDEIFCSAYSDVPYGKLVPTKPSYRYEEEIEVKCDDGYMLQMELNKPKCTSNGWSPPPVCVSKKCSRPDIKDGYMFYTYYFPRNIGSYVDYQCESDYMSHQRTYWGRIRCTDLGWNPEPKCSRQCIKHKSSVQNAKLKDEQNLYLEGEKVKFECISNFLTPDGKTDGERTCLPNGEFTPAKCSKFNCTISDDGNLIRKPFKESYTVTDHVLLDCEEGYIKEGPNTVTCTTYGWNPPLPTCGIGAQCGPPPVVQYGDTIGFSKPFYNSTESVEYKCPEYYVLQGNKNVRCLNGVWEKAPVCLEPCTTKEKDMEDNKIRIRYRSNGKIYSQHGDTLEFSCLYGYNAPPGTQMRITCQQGKLQYPKCFKTGFCVLDQPTMMTRNIHYNVSTIVDNGETITFQCNEETIPENKLEAKCELGAINYPKCSVASPCKISTEDLNLYNIQLLPSDAPEKILNITHRHGRHLNVTCKSGFNHPTQAAMVIKCYDGEFRYPRCFAGSTCRIDQDELDRNNLELDEVHDNEVFYEENERVHFKCKTGYYRRTKLIGKCSKETLTYPSCTAESSG